jgi:hypothetical protein
LAFAELIERERWIGIGMWWFVDEMCLLEETTELAAGEHRGWIELTCDQTVVILVLRTFPSYVEMINGR